MTIKPNRTDLSMHDAKVIDGGRAMRILATYLPIKGVPNVRDVQEWLSTSLGDLASEVNARLDTINVNAEQAFLTMIVERRMKRAPISAMEKMVKAGPNSFADQQNHVWTLVQRENGTPYLLRSDGASVEEMLNARKAALRGGWNGRGAHKRTRVMLASVDTIPTTCGGYSTVGVDDVVDFLANSETMRGTVKTMTPDGVKIVPLGGGTPYTVDAQAIIAVVEQSARSLREKDDNLRDYWKNQYPGNPKMVEMITPHSTRSTDHDLPIDVEKIEASASRPVSARLGGRVRGGGTK